MKYFLVATTIALTGLFVGSGVGSYFTSSQLLKQFQNIPGSPVILNATYDKDKHTITYTVSNPGTVPITVIEKAFVFTPGKESREKEYVISNIPANITIPPMSVTMIKLKLKEGTESLKYGDLIFATFTYKHSLSKDIYTVVHSFKYGSEKVEKATVNEGKGEESK
ncbi:MAG TPA: hypothetical protein EYG91_04760 [Aquifex aeolicus]|nr:hypothetical protein [Aquifex aeolicus]